MVAQSTIEAAYIAAVMTSQAIWLKRILEDMRKAQEEAIETYCDNKSTIDMVKSLVFITGQSTLASNTTSLKKQKQTRR